MSKREMSRRRNRARKGLVDVDPVGVATVRAFIAQHHPSAHLPREDIFAFVANCDTTDETYVIVS